MTVNKDQAMQDWISNYAGADSVLFNFLEANANSFALVPIPGESVINTYINGAARKQYLFALQTMQAMSQHADDVNTQAMYVMRQWQDWIDEQESAGNYPAFGEKCSDYRLENRSNMPMLAARYQDEQMAKYQFIAALYYMEGK
jgi:hypothetical protein